MGFKVLEEKGYDLEQFLCRCPSKTPEARALKVDHAALITITLIDQDKMEPILTRAITTNLSLIQKGLNNIADLSKILPEDPIAALYVILTNNVDGSKNAKGIESLCKKKGLSLKK